MREIDNKATDNIHTYESTRVASILKKLEADHKVAEDISEIKINIKTLMQNQGNIMFYIELHKNFQTLGNKIKTGQTYRVLYFSVKKIKVQFFKKL